MFRTLLAGTALAGLVATSALAQGTAAPASPAAQAPMPDAGAADYVRRLEPNQALASDLTGASVYATAAPGARALGEIRDLVVGSDERLAGVVIETSGLDRRKTVAAAADKIAWTKDGDRLRVVLRAPASELAAAPAFAGRPAAGNGAAAPGSGTTPPARSATKVAAAPTATAAGTGASASGYLAALADEQQLSQDVIGSNVHSGAGDDAPTIGSVNDLVLTPEGRIPIAVVGVGGFLGVGEKNVGVPYRALSIRPGSDGEPRLVMAATREQLTNAPTFDEGGAASGDGAAAIPNTDPATTASTGATNDVSSLKPVAGAELAADNLQGVAVYGPNDQAIGKVGDIALTADGRVDAVVVDVGGFLGLGSKPVAVAMENLRFMRDTNGTINIYTQFTQAQLKSAPEFERESYARNRGTMRLAPAGSPDAGATAPAR